MNREIRESHYETEKGTFSECEENNLYKDRVKSNTVNIWDVKVGQSLSEMTAKTEEIPSQRRNTW